VAFGWGSWIRHWVVPAGIVLVATSLVIWAGEGNPWQVWRALVQGSLGSEAQMGRVLATVVPLQLASSGLIITFATRLYNLGVEGQIVVGAIVTTGVMRWVEGNVAPTLGIP